MSEFSFQQKNLYQQGYQTYTAQQLRQIEWGLRFTPGVCSSITLYGLLTHNAYLLYVVAFLGMWAFFFPAGHPMDLIYNHGVRHLFGAVKLPPNPLQRRLACFSAGIMNTMAASFFMAGIPLAALITGGSLLILQAIVILTHFCMLSWFYELFMRALGRWAVPLDIPTARGYLQAGAVLVDVRGRDEFDSGHLPGAINLPLDEIDQHGSSLDGRIALLYCTSGTRSQIAKQRLMQLGIPNVYDIGAFLRAKTISSADGEPVLDTVTG